MITVSLKGGDNSEGGASNIEGAIRFVIRPKASLLSLLFHHRRQVMTGKSREKIAKNQRFLDDRCPYFLFGFQAYARQVDWIRDG
jgi:hypothetical protein